MNSSNFKTSLMIMKGSNFTWTRLSTRLPPSLPTGILNLHCPLQWGSEIWTILDFKLSKRGWFANGPDFEWDLKWWPFCQKLFEIWKKCLDFEWSGFQMVGTIAIAKATTWPFENHNLFTSRIQMVMSDCQMLGIQAMVQIPDHFFQFSDTF